MKYLIKVMISIKLSNSIKAMNLILDFHQGDEFRQIKESKQGGQFNQIINFRDNEICKESLS